MSKTDGSPKSQKKNIRKFYWRARGKKREKVARNDGSYSIAEQDEIARKILNDPDNHFWNPPPEEKS